MIPIRDVVPTRTQPIVTLLVIAGHAAVFAGAAWFGGTPDAGGAPQPPASAMLRHVGLLHLGTAMLYLWLFGDTVEDRMGHRRYPAFYLMCGLSAVLVPDALGWPVAATGASGAVSGVLGGYLMLYPRSRIVAIVPLPFRVHATELPAAFFAAVWFLLPFVLPGVENAGENRATGHLALFWTQVAGFVAGGVLVLAFRRRERMSVEWWSPR